MTDNTSTLAARLSQPKSTRPTAPKHQIRDKRRRPIEPGNYVFDDGQNGVGVVLAVSPHSATAFVVLLSNESGRSGLTAQAARSLIVSDHPPMRRAELLRLAHVHGLQIDVEPDATPVDRGDTIQVRRLVDVEPSPVGDELPSFDQITASIDQLGELVAELAPLLCRVSTVVTEQITFADAVARTETHSLANALLLSVTAMLASAHQTRASHAMRT